MELKEQTDLRHNKTAMILGLGIALGTLVWYFLTDKKSVVIDTVPFCLLAVLSAVIMVFGFMKYQEKDMARHLVFLGIAIAYGNAMFCSFSEPQVYAFTFLIVCIVIFYGQANVSLIGSVVAIGFNAIYTLIVYLNYRGVLHVVAVDGKQVHTVLTNLLFVIGTCLLGSAAVVSIMRDNKGFIDIMKDDMERKSASAEKLVSTSHLIVSELKEAMTQVDGLSSYMDRMKDASRISQNQCKKQQMLLVCKQIQARISLHL